MSVIPIPKSTGAAILPLLRLWILPFLAGGLILADMMFAGMNSVQTTMIAALFIVIVGVPHGTLDIEIASTRFGKSNLSGKIAILAGYLACAAGMAICWMVAPAIALAVFLIISIIHFGLDWRGGADPFLAMMVGWALIALPALSHPQEVSEIFALLTGSPTGSTISALLACAAAPAALGSLVFAFWAYKNNERQNAIDVIACMAAAIFLPPLMAFAIFFCGLHSPRHMAEALRESEGISSAKKIMIIAAVFLLSLAIGVVLFLGQSDLQLESSVIRTAFMLISILTVPHFVLEHYKPTAKMWQNSVVQTMSVTGIFNRTIETPVDLLPKSPTSKLKRGLPPTRMALRRDMMDSYLQNYINGKWVDSIGGTRHQVISPSTEEACTEITLGTAADVDAAVAAAREAFRTFSQTTREERLALMGRIIEEYKKRIPDFAQSMAAEMGAPVSFATMAQAPAGLGGFLGTVPALENFAFTEQHGKNTVVYEPMGVVGLITPWNWPLNQIALKVAPCIAAGNTMVLKPSEECPGNAAIFAEVMDAAGVPPGVFNLVQGDGMTVGAAISAHPGIDMVSFTGSTRAGILVAKSAADTVKRVHQELGGKSPNLVLPDADFAAVLPGTVSGVLINTGQSCIAPTRILVAKEREAEAAGFITAMFEGTKVGDPMAEGGHIGPVVNKAQYEKIQGLIQSAIDEGAHMHTGGTDRPADLNRGYYIKPTVFSGVTPDMRIAKEEVFGPVATIMAYDTIEQGIEIANDTEYGLSAVISGDPAKAASIAPKLQAGMVAINSWGPAPGAPFGGYKQSGNGREGGVFGLKDFMETKSISGLPA